MGFGGEGGKRGYSGLKAWRSQRKTFSRSLTVDDGLGGNRKEIKEIEIVENIRETLNINL